MACLNKATGCLNGMFEHGMPGQGNGMFERDVSTACLDKATGCLNKACPHKANSQHVCVCVCVWVSPV